MKNQKLHLVIGTSLTLANTQLGAALLSLPFTLARIGLPAGLAFLIFAFLFSVFGFFAIVDSVYFTDAKTMRGMIDNIFGKVVSTIIDACIALMYCGLLVSYDSIFSDYLRIFILGVSGVQVDVRIIKACSVVILAPLTMLSSPSQLSQVSAFAILLIILTVCCVIARYAQARIHGYVDMMVGTDLVPKHPLSKVGDLVAPSHVIGWKAFLEIIQRIPLFMPLYGCHATIPVLFQDLPCTSDDRRSVMKSSLLSACVFSSVIYLLNTLCAYLMFGRDIAGNVFLSFNSKDYLMTTMRLLYAINIALSFACVVYPIRAIFMGWLRVARNTRSGKIWFYCIGFALSVLAVLISIFVPDIVKVFNSISALFGIAVYWVIPVITRWKNPQLKFDYEHTEKKESPQEPVRTFPAQSFLQTFIRQSLCISRDWQIPRQRTRSEIQDEIKQLAERERAMTVKQREIKSSFEMVREAPRNNSVSQSRPAEINQLLAELAQNDVSEGVLQAAIEAVIEVKNRSIDLVRQEQCSQMTPRRKGAMITCCLAIVIVDLTAFFLSTFYDMGTK